MEEKIEALESRFEETGLLLKRDVERCRRLYGEFVEQILEVREFLSLDVVQEELEIPNIWPLKDTLQDRTGIEYSTERYRILPEKETSKSTDEGTGKAGDSTDLDLAPRDDFDMEMEKPVIMSEKSIQTTPLWRERPTLGKRSLLKFLQKSKILKEGDIVYFPRDRYYDADISQSVCDLNSANSSDAIDGPTLYPNSSCDSGSSFARTPLSDVANTSNEPQDERVSSCTKETTSMEKKGFKRVRSSRQSLVSFLIPEKGDLGGTDNEERSINELSLSNPSKSNEVSVYQSISLLTNCGNSLNCSSELSTQLNESNIPENSVDMESKASFSADEHSCMSHGTANHGKVDDDPSEMVGEQSEVHDSVKEVFKDGDIEASRVPVELECDYSGCQTEECMEGEIGDHSANASLVKKVDPSVYDSASEELNHKEIVTNQVAESDNDILSPTEIENVSIIQHSSQLAKDGIFDTKPEETGVVKNRPPKHNVRRKRRRGPPLEMPKNYVRSRKDLIPLYNKTRTRTSKGLLFRATSFRTEPLSVDLKKFRETPAGKCVLKGRKIPEKKEDFISKQRSPLFPVSSDVDDNAKGFDIIQRVVWTPKSAEKEDVNRNDSLLIADDDIHVADTKEGSSLKSINSTESLMDEVFMSIKAKPKRNHREDPYNIDLALEITVQNADTCSPKKKMAGPKRVGNVGVKLNDGKLNGRNTTLDSQVSGTVPNEKIVVGDILSKSEDASNSEKAASFGDIEVSYRRFSRRQRKTRRLDETQKSLNDDFEGARILKRGGSKDASSMKSITEVDGLFGESGVSRNDVVSDSKNNIKNQNDGLEVTVNGKKDLGLEVNSGRVTRSSQNAVRDSAKEVLKIKAPRRTRNTTTKTKKCHSSQSNEKCVENDRKQSRRDEEASKVQANGSKKGDKKLSSKQVVETKRKVRQSSKHQESACDNDEVGDASKEINNESIALSKPRRARKKPSFYNSVDSSFVKLSANRQKSIESCSVKSNQKSERKAEAKSTTRSGKQLDKKTNGKAEMNGTFIVDIRETESEKNSRSKGPVKVPCSYDESITSAAEDDHELVCHKKENDVCDVGDVEIVEEKQTCQQELINSDCRTIERRGRKVSIAPSLIIISEGEENSKALSSPDVEATDFQKELNEGERSLSTADASHEGNGQKDVEELGQNSEGNLSLQGKRRGRPKKELTSTKKRGKTKSSFQVIDSGSLKESSNIVDVATEAVSSDVKIGNGTEDTRMGKKSGRGGKSGDKASNSRNRKRGRVKGRKSTQKGNGESKDKVVATEVHEMERVVNDVDEALETESKRVSVESNSTTASVTVETCPDKEGTVELSSLKTPDLRRSTRKTKNKSSVKGEEENGFVMPKTLPKGAVKKSPLNKRPVGGGKENAVPQKKRRTLFNKKNSSLMSLNFSVMKETTIVNATQNSTMNTSSYVMPQTLSNFLRSFVAPKVKKKS